jgi:transposase-like protein
MDERIRLIALWNEGQASVTELSRAFGISRKTVYKWLQRYEARGRRGSRTNRRWRITIRTRRRRLW